MEETCAASRIQAWLSTFAFSRPIHHAARDFSDAVLLAELLSQVLPAGAVALHNYPSTGKLQRKLINWDLLNRKVLVPLRCEISTPFQDDLARGAPGAIALLLIRVKKAVEQRACCSPRSPKPTTAMVGSGSPVVSNLNQPARVKTNLKSPPLSPSKCRSASPVKTLSSGRLTQRPRCSPSKSSRQHPGYSLADVLPLPSERPSPGTMESTSKNVLRLTQSPGRDAPRASAKSNSQPSKRAAFALDYDHSSSGVMPVAARPVVAASSNSEEGVNGQSKTCSDTAIRHVWSATSPRSSTTPTPGDFSTTALARIQCTPIGIEAPLELCPSPMDLTPPRTIDNLLIEQIQLKLCLSPIVFPRVQVPVDEVLNTAPPKYPASSRRQQHRSSQKAAVREPQPSPPQDRARVKEERGRLPR